MTDLTNLTDQLTSQALDPGAHDGDALIVDALASEGRHAHGEAPAPAHPLDDLAVVRVAALDHRSHGRPVRSCLLGRAQVAGPQEQVELLLGIEAARAAAPRGTILVVAVAAVRVQVADRR